MSVPSKDCSLCLNHFNGPSIQMQPIYFIVGTLTFMRIFHWAEITFLTSAERSPLVFWHQIKQIFTIKSTHIKDGGVGRYTLPPHTIKRRTTTSLKTKNNQNCQKIKLYGSLTTKELKKKYSLRLVGGIKTGSQGGEGAWQGRTWGVGGG